VSNFDNFPILALPSGLRDVVLELHQHTQAPYALIAGSVLGAVSLACQDKLNMERLPGLVSPVSLYMVTVAESGERKTSVDRPVSKVFRDFEETQAALLAPEIENFKAQKLAWEEEQKGLAQAIRKAAKNQEPTGDLARELQKLQTREPVKPKVPKLVFQDATPEAIARSLHENSPSAGLFSDEGAIIFDSRAMGRLGMLNALWGGDPYHVERVTQPSFTLRRVRFSLSVMVQPSVLQKFLAGKGDQLRGIGLAARCLIAWPASTQGTRFVTNPGASWYHLPRFRERITAILGQAGGQPMATLKFDPAAQKSWTDFANFVELNLGQAQPFSDIRDSAAKIAENAARMAALLHFFEGREGDVGLETINQAIQVCLWHLGEFKRLFGAPAQIAPEMADALELERWVHSFCARFPGVNSLKRNYISQYGPNQLRNKLRRDMALSILARNGRVFFVRHEKSLLIQLNPQYFPVTPFARSVSLNPSPVNQPFPNQAALPPLFSQP